MTDTTLLVPYTCNHVHREIDRQMRFDIYAKELEDEGTVDDKNDATLLHILTDIAHEAAVIAQAEGASLVREVLQGHITELETRIDELTYRVENPEHEF